MARVKRAVNAHKKRRAVLERASGYRGTTVPPVSQGERASHAFAGLFLP